MSVGDDDRSSKKGKTGINRYMGEKSVNKKGLFSRIRDAIFGDRDLWQQLLSVAIIISIAGALISAVISIILGNSLIAIIAYFASCILAAASLVMYCLLYTSQMCIRDRSESKKHDICSRVFFSGHELHPHAYHVFFFRRISRRHASMAFVESCPHMDGSTQ